MSTVSVGSGNDKLVLLVSQDAYQGDAEYSITVDGVPYGGVLTASSLHGTGQSDTVTVSGDWQAGPHSVSVTLLNDAWGGTPDTDRNLYLDGATYNGLAVPDSTATLLSAGPAEFSFTERGPYLAVFEPTSTTIGSGPDALVLKISQDGVQPAYAQYTVSVDGVQIGGVLNAGALHDSGQSDTVTVLGDWGPGDHAVSVAFLNDFYDPAAGLDRNLYLDGATYNGLAVPDSTATLLSAGPSEFSFAERGPYLAVFEPTSTTIGSGPDALVLKISQDGVQPAYAQYTVSVDGVQIDGVLNAGALHDSGQSDTVTVLGDWGPGDHTVSVTFLNDFYDPAAGLDRNLYLDGATFNGQPVSDTHSVAAILSSGPASFEFGQAAAEPEQVDWEALAAQVLANYEATGQWFL